MTKTVELSRRELAVACYALYLMQERGWALADEYAQRGSRVAFDNVVDETIEAEKLRVKLSDLKEGMTDD